MRPRSNDQYRRLHRALLAAGWVHTPSRKHHQYRPPPERTDAPAVIVLPTTPGKGDIGYKNARAKLRRAGIPV